MQASLWVIASVVLLILAWVLWSFLRVYLPVRAFARLEEKVIDVEQNLTNLAAREEEAVAKRRGELSDLIPPSVEEGRDLEIYKGLTKTANLAELWARARTRVVPGRKNAPKDAELMRKIARLTLEIETFIENEVASNAIAQIGDWNAEKVAFFQKAGMKQRASIAAIYQLVSEIKRELQV